MTYDYKCDECSSIYEVKHGMNESPDLTCETCGHGKMHKHFGGDSGHIQKYGDGKTMTHWEEVKYRK